MKMKSKRTVYSFLFHKLGTRVETRSWKKTLKFFSQSDNKWRHYTHNKVVGREERRGEGPLYVTPDLRLWTPLQ